MAKKHKINKNVERKQNFLTYIYKHLVFVILSLVLCTLCGFGYGILAVEPLYTTTTTVMLVTGIDTQTGQASGSNNVTLSQLYLPSVVEMIKSEEFIVGANKQYKIDNSNGGEISKGRVSVRYGNVNSLIFSVSYTDESPELSEIKLDAVINNAKANLKYSIKADNVVLKETCNDKQQKKTYNYSKYIILGLLSGALLAGGVLTIRYFADNTVKDRDEIESLTGVSVLSYIDKVEDPITKK